MYIRLNVGFSTMKSFGGIIVSFIISVSVIIYVHKQLITILLEGLLLDFCSKAGGHIVPICCDHIGPIGQVREFAYATVHGCKGKY